ncbi:hypothetical protein DESC_780298 [Desulfosarcina cetonica]|nr:hypothetical protein DESC_780298 [Desulfosarcina cetonica]
MFFLLGTNIGFAGYAIGVGVFPTYLNFGLSRDSINLYEIIALKFADFGHQIHRPNHQSGESKDRWGTSVIR